MAGKRIALEGLPSDSRPREKLLQRGPSALSDAELLAWLNQSRSVITFPAEVDLPRQQMAGELVAKVRAKYADILAWDAAIVS